MRKTFLTFVAFCLVVSAYANENLHPLITNVPNRTAKSLNGQWDYIIDRYEVGYYDYRLQPGKWGFFKDQKPKSESDLVEYSFEKSKKMFIPGDWNTADQELKYYEGTVWFRKTFDFSPEENERYFLYFGAVNYEALVYLNGEYIGSHKGGFTPFNFEVTGKLKNGHNFVVVKVDNTRHKDEVPTVNTDWWNYGGITRDVLILKESETFVRDFSVFLSDGKYNEISGWVQLDGTNLQTPVKVSIPELEEEVTINPDEEGKGTFSLKAKPDLWSPQNPKLYEISISVAGNSMREQVAFRHVEAVGNRIHLNGDPVFLRGICIHEEAPFRAGRFNSPAEAHTLLSWAKEMNANFVRLAHYPHNEYMVREAEKMGILVWSEIPVYWTISFTNESTLQNAQNQLEEMITRDKNRGAVIIWSLANETPVSDVRNRFLTKLVQHARKLDDSRLISMAMEKEYHDAFTPAINDPLMDIVDVVSFNTYIGWYDGLPEKCAKMNWKLPNDKPVVISEFGAGALQGYHGTKNQRWTEEYQEELYIQSVAMFDKMDLAGTAPWILMDFMSPRRVLPEIQDGWNRKGLISDQGIKKKAFFIMKEWYKKKR
ncbi:glycoside hydrolase family 2 protein [Anaerophaga thermohalophila]|jgi:beta-glucuronidase|uniref:glycoside hydrolase family 2 protein n=1 Tax=Anaerophaga thermohalophila TaxID=177400 RepID=UPI0002F7A327|nr:glycoside hydrolase family 2 TIM barrel-domain containing protein [Anaerophaga thermohalophila]